MNLDNIVVTRFIKRLENLEVAKEKLEGVTQEY